MWLPTMNWKAHPIAREVLLGRRGFFVLAHPSPRTLLPFPVAEWLAGVLQIAQPRGMRRQLPPNS